MAIMQKNTKVRNATLYIVRVAFMAAMLTVFKLALSFVPNVEIVTLLIAAYASAMGIVYALPAALIFCTVEIALYGVGSWVLLYYVYWCLLATVCGLSLKGGRVVFAVIIGAVGSALFGVLSACCDTIFCAAGLAPSQLGKYWVAYYIKGLYFDVVHIISNAVIMSVLYLPLVLALKRIAPDACVSAGISGRLKKFMRDEYLRIG